MKPKLADPGYDLRQMPASFSGLRVETGPVQFGDDYPGLFVRGDDAFHYSNSLENVLMHIKADDGHNVLALAVVQGLIKLLRSARVG